MKKLSLIGTMAMALAFGLAACDDSTSNAEGTNGENSVPGGNGGSASGADPATAVSELYARTDLTQLDPTCGSGAACDFCTEQCYEYKSAGCDGFDGSQDVWEYSWRYKTYYRGYGDPNKYDLLTNAGSGRIEFHGDQVVETLATMEQLVGEDCEPRDPNVEDLGGMRIETTYSCENGARKIVEKTTYTATKEQFIAQYNEMKTLGFESRCDFSIDK
jgi:hypothetical protein